MGQENGGLAAPRRGLIRALTLSLVTLVIPVAGAFLVPEIYSDYEALLWLTALIPAFLWSYYRGWRGAATSLAFGMAVLSVTYALAATSGRPLPKLLYGVVIAYIVLSLMIGWLAERLHRDVRRVHFEGTAFTDAVTGLPNRKHAELHLEIEIGAAQRGRVLTVVLLDIDHFANYNARHGEIAGDEILRVVATALKHVMRRTNLAARLDDDSFLCILGGTDEDGALVFTTRLQEMLRSGAGHLALPTVSAGVAAYRPGMKGGEDLLAAAQEALGRAKKEGAGRVRIHGREVQVLEAQSTPAPTREPGRVLMPEGRGAGRKALVVVEEAPMRSLLARYLGDYGFKVAQVSNVVDGVQCLTVEYDVLVTDIALVDGPGVELVRAAKLRWPSIQVLGLTDVTQQPAAVETLNAGVDRYIEKPLDLAKLRQHLTELLARRDRLVASVLDSRQLTLEFQAEKAEAANALRRSEEEYRNVVESLQEIIFRVDKGCAFTFLNWAWSAVTGHPLDESLGHIAVDFVQREDRARFKTRMEALLEGDLEEAREELRLIARDGNPCWVDLRARRTFAEDGSVSGATGTMDDITRRKHAEDQLRRTEAASRALLAALPDQVFGLSRSGVVLTRQGSNGREHRVGRNLEDILTPDIARQYRDSLERLFATREVQICEYRLESAEGPQQYEARLALTDDEEAVAIVRNISDRRRLEEQLRQSQKLEAIGRLAGGLAHDFNNLLTVVQGNAHLIMDEFPAHPDARDYAEQINSAAGRGADLVKQMLAFGRKQVLQPRLLNLNTIVESVHAMLPRLIGEDIVIEMDLDPALGQVKADPGQIEQVLVNLATFAQARLPQGGALRVRTRNLERGPDYDPSVVNLHGTDLVRLEMEDNGPVLDEQTRVQVFEPFFGANSTPPSGLGLATVYGIVTQSGGTIILDDAPQGGARFQIFFPRAEVV